MVKLGDLQDDELYEELLEDVAEKCNTHGAVKSIVIPRGGTEESIHLDGESYGKIFVQFVSAECVTICNLQIVASYGSLHITSSSRVAEMMIVDEAV